MVGKQLVVVLAPRPLPGRRGRPELEEVLSDLRHQELRLPLRLEPTEHVGQLVVHEGGLELLQPFERRKLESAHFG